jgi:hypothetical protein
VSAPVNRNEFAGAILDSVLSIEILGMLFKRSKSITAFTGAGTPKEDLNPKIRGGIKWI